MRQLGSMQLGSMLPTVLTVWEGGPLHHQSCAILLQQGNEQGQMRAALRLGAAMMARVPVEHHKTGLDPSSQSSSPSTQSTQSLAEQTSLLISAEKWLRIALFLADKLALNFLRDAQMYLACLTFFKGEEQEALELVAKHLQGWMFLGRNNFVGCRQIRGEDTRMLTCNGCHVARSSFLPSPLLSSPLLLTLALYSLLECYTHITHMLHISLPFAAADYNARMYAPGFAMLSTEKWRGGTREYTTKLCATRTFVRSSSKTTVLSKKTMTICFLLQEEIRVLLRRVTSGVPQGTTWLASAKSRLAPITLTGTTVIFRLARFRLHIPNSLQRVGGAWILTVEGTL